MAAVRAAEPRASRFVLWDAEVPGFGVVVHPSGRKSYVLKYRNAGGTIRKPSIGTFPALKVRDAREQARRWLAEVSNGGDPSLARQDARRVETFGTLGERFMAEHVREMLKPKTAKSYADIWCLHVPEKLKRTKLDVVDQRRIERLHRAVGEKTGRYIANRLVAMLSSLYSWAGKRGMVSAGVNPAKAIVRFREEARDRFLSAEERARLEAVLDAAAEVTPGEAGHVSHSAVRCIRLLMLTGARLSEITRLTWGEVDVDRRVLRLRDSKTGARLVPLSTRAVDLLTSLRSERIVGVELVLPTRGGRELANMQRAWRTLRHRAGLDDVRIHDLRRSAASDALWAGMDLERLRLVMGHKSAATTRRYAYLAGADVLEAAEQMDLAMQRRSEAGAAALAEREGRGHVVPLDRKVRT